MDPQPGGTDFIPELEWQPLIFVQEKEQTETEAIY